MDDVKEVSGVGGLTVWNQEYRGNDIPGSTRVPIMELLDFFNGQTDNLVGLDVGSGQGRSTQRLKDVFKGSKITALDLSFEGLKLTQADGRVQAKAEELPFEPESFDFVNLCGVMTNLVDDNPQKAQELRSKVASSLFTATKKGGCVIISDFGAEHLIDNYDVNYDRHSLITGERGTIAVLKSGESFLGKTDEQIRAMKGTGAIERYAHHYTPQELITLFKAAGFQIKKYGVETTKTPKGGRTIENIVMVAEKPK